MEQFFFLIAWLVIAFGGFWLIRAQDTDSYIIACVEVGLLLFILTVLAYVAWTVNEAS